MNTANEDAPTEVADPEPKPDVETTPKTSNEADSQDVRKPSRDPNRARSILRGEIPKEETAKEGEAQAESETDAEVIARMFDQETGQFIEQDEAEEEPAAGKAAEKPKAKPEAAKPEAADTDEGEPESDDEEEAGKKPEPKKRISIKRDRLGDRDFAIVQLADRENISLDEAKARLFGDTPAAAKPAEEKSSEAARETPADIQAKIDTLLEQRKAANKALDVDKATELTDQIAELKLQKRDTEQALQREEQDRTASHRDAVIASASKAVALYPDSAEEGTELYDAINAERLQREKTDPGFFRNKNWPMVLAVEVAAEMGVAPVSKKSAAEEKPPTEKKPAAEKPATPPKKPARPAPPTPAPGTATGAAKPNQEEALRAELKAAKASKDADQIKAVMRKIDALPAGKR